MRIGIDNISPGESTGRLAPGGMRLYLESLLTEFARCPSHHQFVLFTPAWADPLLDVLPPNVQVVALPHVPISRPLRVLYQQTAYASILARQDLDVFFATATVAPVLCRVPIVLAVQFIQFYQWPEGYGRFRSIYMRHMLPLSLRNARKAIIFTESAKRDLMRWTGVAANKIDVVPHGLSKDIRRLAERDQRAPERWVGVQLANGRPYILYVSSTYDYKNHARLIRAFGLLKQRTHLPHALLLVGSEAGVSFQYLRTVADQAGVREDVIIAGRLDHHLAAATYLGADLAVIPTLYETFGFPPLEAMACGCPVVASNIGSLVELAGDAAVLVDPLDENSMANGMEQVLSNPALRQNLVARGKRRASEYTWERSAARTIGIIEEVGRA